VHDQGTPYPDVKSAITVQSNTETVLSIHRTFVKKLDDPYSDCIKTGYDHQSYIYKYIINEMKSKYKQSDCIDLLIQQNSIETCNCTIAVLPKLSNKVKSCDNYNLTVCGFRSFANRDKFIADHMYLCPLECDSIDYSVSTTVSGPLSSNMKFTTSFGKFRKLYNESLSVDVESEYDDEVLKNVAYIRVTYRDLSYTEIIEIPNFTLISLISSFGGTLGLFLGMSLISFFEIFEFLIELIYSKYQNINNNNNNNNNNDK
jgi:hypothetical protein